MRSNLGDHVTPRRILGLLLAVSLLKGLVWSIIIPPWHAPDESTHFIYGQMIQRDHTVHPGDSFWRPWEIGISWETVQIRTVRFNPTKFFDFSDRSTISNALQQLQEPTAIRNALPEDPFWNYSFRIFTYLHPPLYYFGIAAMQAIFADQSILVRILASRWFSVFLGVVLTALAYRVGEYVFQSDAWGLLVAALAAFHPMTSFITAVINNNALEIVLFSACLLALLIILREGLSMRRAIWLGVLLGASLMSRVSLLSLIPLVLAAFLWNIYSLRQAGRLNSWKPALWLWVATLPVLMAGWWYLDAFNHNAPPVIAGPSASNTDPVVNEQPRVYLYDWVGTGTRLAQSYWGNFGWLDTPLPASLANPLVGLNIAAFALTAVWVLRRLRRRRNLQIPRPGLILFLALAMLAMGFFYFGLDTSIGFGLQARYFLPPIIAQMIWLALGLVALTSASWRAGVMWLLGMGMIALNLFTLFSVIALRYYGARNLLLLVDRATVLQPVPAGAVLILIAIYFLGLALFAPVFWRACQQEPLPTL